MSDSNGLFGDDAYDPYDDHGSAASAVVGEDLPLPQHAKDITGFDYIEKELVSLINKGELPHSLIFAGPKGIGKSTMAFRLARYLVKNGVASAIDAGPSLFGDDLPSEDITSLDIDPEDKVFTQIAAGAHPDMLYLGQLYETDKKAGKGINVEQARKVVPFMRMTASGTGWRVVIIDDADLMQRSAQNAILKILEEPPINTLLILVTHRLGSLIATIKSRCRTIRFGDMSKDHFYDLVGRYQSLSADDMEVMYSLTRGSVGRTIELLEEGGLTSVYMILDMFQSFPIWDWPKIHQASQSMGGRGQEQNMQIFKDIALWMIDMMLRAKATGKQLPGMLDDPALNAMLRSYTLNEWINISDAVRTYFQNARISNLDNRQTIFGLFTLFEVKKVA